jgi:hypothetical protein
VSGALVTRTLLALALLTFGCAQSTTLGGDAGEDASPLDAGPPDTGEMDASCDVSPVPDALPALDGSFEIVDTTAGMTPPVLVGGDPRGVWVFDTATFWVQHDATAMFNPYASSASGTAWIAIDDTTFRLDYEIVTMLAGTAAGSIVSATSNRAYARYRVDREQLEPTGLVCADSTGGSTGDAGRVTFTRSGDRIVVATELVAEAGPVLMVLEGTRRP